MENNNVVTVMTIVQWWHQND